jgi:hypothetical protein
VAPAGTSDITPDCAPIRLRSDPRSLSNPQVSSHTRLSANLHEVAEHRRARDADLRHHDAAPAELDVVSDLDEVIEA